MPKIEYRRCRMCDQVCNSRALIKYGVRHYAHARCLIAARGVDGALQTTPAYRRSQVILCAREMGLTPRGNCPRCGHPKSPIATTCVMCRYRPSVDHEVGDVRG